MQNFMNMSYEIADNDMKSEAEAKKIPYTIFTLVGLYLDHVLST